MKLSASFTELCKKDQHTTEGIELCAHTSAMYPAGCGKASIATQITDTLVLVTFLVIVTKYLVVPELWDGP